MIVDSASSALCGGTNGACYCIRIRYNKWGSPNLIMRKAISLRRWHNASGKTFFLFPCISDQSETRHVARLSPKLVLNNYYFTNNSTALSFPPTTLLTNTLLIIIMVLLVTSDSEQFNADKDVVERSVLIKNMLEGWCRLLLLFTFFQQPFFIWF